MATQISGLFVIPLAGILTDFRVCYTYQTMWAYSFRLFMAISCVLLVNPTGDIAMAIVILFTLATNVELVVVTSMFTKLIPSDLIGPFNGFIESSVSGTMILFSFISSLIVKYTGAIGPVYIVIGGDILVICLACWAYIKHKTMFKELKPVKKTAEERELIENLVKGKWLKDDI